MLDWEQAEAETAPAALEELLNGDLPSLPDLQLGQLDNGLRYVILPNKVPEDRFEAHLEVHAGATAKPSNVDINWYWRPLVDRR